MKNMDGKKEKGMNRKQRKKARKKQKYTETETKQGIKKETRT
jgi:hypothetical protein